MVSLIISLFIIIGFFAFVFYSDRVSLSAKTARLSRIILAVLFFVGILLCTASVVLLTLNINNLKIDAMAKDVIWDSFDLFIIADSAFIVFGIIITLVSSLLKSKLRVMIPFILPMWAAISYFWTYIFTVWSDFLAFEATPYILLFGIGVSFLLVISSLPDIQRRITVLSDPVRVESIKTQRAGKKKYREDQKKEKKRIARLKKKLKHPEH